MVAPVSASAEPVPRDKLVDDLRAALLEEVERLCKVKYVNEWSIHMVSMPRLRRPLEIIQVDHERAEMRAPVADEPACRMDQHCQANMLYLVQRDAPPDCGFIMKAFRTPSGLFIGNLCVLCLRLVMARDGKRFWVSDAPDFRALQYKYVDGAPEITF